MTDTEIIKALRDLIHFGVIVDKQTLKEALDLINRRDKTINRLKAENKNCGVKIQNQREQLKATNQKIKEQQAEIERLKYIKEREKQRQLEKTKDNESCLGVLDDLLTKSYKENKELKAEIERLKRLFAEEEAKYSVCAKQFYKEGAKDFSERVKDKKFEIPVDAHSVGYLFGAEDIDDILKEMGCE